MTKQVCVIKTDETPVVGSWVNGHVVEHPRFFHGQFIHTSTIVSVSEDGKSFETLNSFYTIDNS